MSDVFISYSRKDKTFVQRLFAALEAQGHDTWVDWDDIEYAEDWWRKIQRGIAEANNFVFIVSPHSVRSKVCFDEVQYAVETNKRIIPVVLADVDDPVDQERMHPALKQHNWLFFREEDAFDTTLLTLLETIRREPQHVQMHTRLLVNAQEWAAADRNTSLLLRGDNLRQAAAWRDAATGKSPELTALHREYLSASEKAESGTRRRRLASIVVVALIVTVLLVFGLLQAQQNQREQQERDSILQASAALGQLETGAVTEALTTAIAAVQINDPPAEAVAALRQVAGSPGPVAQFSGDAPVTTVALSPDSSRIIAGYADGALRLWDASVAVGSYTTPLFTMPEELWHAEGVNAVDIDLDGRYVVSVGCAQREAPPNSEEDTCTLPEVYLWEMVDDTLVLRQQLNPVDNRGLTRQMSGEAFDVDIRPFITGDGIANVGVAFGSANGPIELRYALGDDGSIEPPWAGYSNSGSSHNGGMIMQIVYNLDDDILSGDIFGRLRYVQGLGGVAQGLDSLRDQPVTALAASPTAEGGRSNRPYLIGYANGQAIVRSRNELRNNLDFGSRVNAVDFHPDGLTALVALENGQLVLLDMANNANRLATMTWEPDLALTALDFGDLRNTDDGPVVAHPDYVVTGSADGTLILWDTAYTDLNTADYPDVASLLAWIEANLYVGG